MLDDFYTSYSYNTLTQTISVGGLFFCPRRMTRACARTRVNHNNIPFADHNNRCVLRWCVRFCRVSQGHPRHGRTGRRAAGARRQRQQLEPALDRAVRSPDQQVDNVDADADAPELGGRRSAVLLQHGRQADGRRRRRHRHPERGRRDGDRRFGHGVRHQFAVQVHGHVRMIAVVDHQRLAVEQRRRFRTFSLVAKLELADAVLQKPISADRLYLRQRRTTLRVCRTKGTSTAQSTNRAYLLPKILHSH